MPEWTTIISELGGGLSALIILALSWAVKHLYARNTTLMDQRIEDHKEHSGQLLENQTSLLTAINALEARK